MFFGYTTEAQMRDANPIIADKLISIALTQHRSVCTRGKQCVGSIDGKEYRYADGSTDNGYTITSYRATIGANVYVWTSINL